MDVRAAFVAQREAAEAMQCRAWRALDAAGAMDAENAPTAPWKSLRDFHKRPPPSLVMTFAADSLGYSPR